jgi:hypothetical protein
MRMNERDRRERLRLEMTELLLLSEYKKIMRRREVFISRIVNS